MSRRSLALLALFLPTPAGCIVGQDNGQVEDANVDTYVVTIGGFTTVASRHVQVEVLSPPDQNPYDATSTWVPLGDEVQADAQPFSYYTPSNLYLWSTSVPLASVPTDTWRTGGLLRLRAREVETNTLLTTFDDLQCIIDHFDDSVLDVVAACRSEYLPVVTVVSSDGLTPQASQYLGIKGNSPLDADNYYANIGIPNPQSYQFEAWKESHHLGFNEPHLVEARYFNGSDLALGRHMNCRNVFACEDGEVCEDDASVCGGLDCNDFPNDCGPILRTVCYVTNYGDPGGDPHDAFADMDSNLAGATVAMEKYYHEPDESTCADRLDSPVPEEDDVRFKVFFHGGNVPQPNDTAVTSVKLDEIQNAQFVPGLCLNCHGGEFQSLPEEAVVGAKFLPFDVDAFEYDDGPGMSKAEQLDAFRQLNAIVLDTEQEGQPDSEPASELAKLIMAWYAGDDPLNPESVRDPGASYDYEARPDDWGPDPGDDYYEVYDDLIKPYCRMCHIAFEDNANTADLTFGSPDSFDAKANVIATYACDLYAMPHSRVTFENFWNTPARMILVNEAHQAEEFPFAGDCAPPP